MRVEHFCLTADGRQPLISGQRQDRCRGPGHCTFQALEISCASFEEVPEIGERYDVRRDRAAWLNGFLHIDIPRARFGRRAATSAVVGASR
jgi:HSP20 family molecular chaperone IbpA